MTRPHLLDALRDQVLLCDGGMGSRVQALTLDVEKDYWNQENCTEVLNLSRPDLVRDIHRGYFEAGADMVETNTFGGQPITLGEFGLQDRTHEINKAAAELAREAAEAAVARCEPGEDLQADAAYRRHLAVVLLTRVLLRAGAAPAAAALAA